jgi:hypothetical protein
MLSENNRSSLTLVVILICHVLILAIQQDPLSTDVEIHVTPRRNIQYSPSMLTKSRYCNLYCAGRCANGNRGVSSAFHVLGAALATGQAVGTTASLKAEHGIDPEADDMRAILLKHELC